jgi:hypothetical protein
MRPIGDAGYKTVFNRIVVDVVDVALEIGVVADGVFPIAPLPNAFLAFCYFAGGTRRRWRQAARESLFDTAPPRREIRVTVG